MPQPDPASVSLLQHRKGSVRSALCDVPSTHRAPQSLGHGAGGLEVPPTDSNKRGGRAVTPLRADAEGSQVCPQPAPLPPPPPQSRDLEEGHSKAPRAALRWAPRLLHPQAPPGEPAPSHGRGIPTLQHQIPRAAPKPQLVPKHPGRVWCLENPGSEQLRYREGAHHCGLGHPRSLPHRGLPAHRAEKHPLDSTM